MKHLSNVKVNYVDPETGALYKKGMLDRLEIKENRIGIKIMGSLAKYYYGNNFRTLTNEETKKAIEKISDSIHLDVRAAQVNRIDFASNFIVSELPSIYFSCLSDSPRLYRSQLRTTLYFTNKIRSLVFYDKCNEAKAYNRIIPIEYANKNVLRYEYRQKRLKRNQFFLSDLYNRNTFNSLLNEWYDRYHSIRRIPKIRIKEEIKGMINLKSFENEGWRLLIKSIGGSDSFFLLLDNEAKRGTISKQNKYYYKKKFDKLLKQPDIFEPSPLMGELDAKVAEAAECYRC